MKKMLGVLLAALLCLNCFGTLNVQAQEIQGEFYGRERLMELEGTVLTPGTELYFAEEYGDYMEPYYVQAEYRFANTSGTVEGFERLMDVVGQYCLGTLGLDFVYAFDNISPDDPERINGVCTLDEPTDINYFCVKTAGPQYGTIVTYDDEGKEELQVLSKQMKVFNTLSSASAWKVVDVEPLVWYAPCAAAYDGDSQFYSENYSIILEPYYATEAGSACNHSYTWNIVRDATDTSDGEMVYCCEHCGNVSEKVKISAYAKFLKGVTDSISKAAPGEVVEIKTDIWMSISKAVATAMQQNPTVAVSIEFAYSGHVFKLTIPAGYDLMIKMNEEGYAGFLYLALDPAFNLQMVK